MPLLIGHYENEILRDEACLRPGGRYLINTGKTGAGVHAWLINCDTDDEGTISEVIYSDGHDWLDKRSRDAVRVRVQYPVLADTPLELTTVAFGRMIVRLSVMHPAVDLAPVRCLYCTTDHRLFNFGAHLSSHGEPVKADGEKFFRQLGIFRRAARSSRLLAESYPILEHEINGLITELDWELFHAACNDGSSSIPVTGSPTLN